MSKRRMPAQLTSRRRDEEAHKVFASQDMVEELLFSRSLRPNGVDKFNGFSYRCSRYTYWYTFNW
jgi:hypothetical protein